MITVSENRPAGATASEASPARTFSRLPLVVVVIIRSELLRSASPECGLDGEGGAGHCGNFSERCRRITLAACGRDKGRNKSGLPLVLRRLGSLRLARSGDA